MRSDQKTRCGSYFSLPILSIMILTMLGGWLSLAAIDPGAFLQQPQVSVGITGYVDKPGIYRFSLGTYLSDAVSMVRFAGEVTLPQTALKDTLAAVTIPQSMRAVTLRRNNVATVYDLSRFLLLGEMQHNPPLKDGDVILIKPVEQTVNISGAVVRPAEYEFLAGDKLGGMLAYAGGFKPEADLANVLLYRYDQDMINYQIITLDLRAYQNDPTRSDLPMQFGDRLMVPVNSQFRRGWKVRVEGHVRSPGEYLISSTTTLYDVLVQCGGPTPQGDLTTAFVINSYLHGKPDPDIERLKEQPMSSMTPMEYNYLRSKLRQLKGKYSIDLKATWESQGSADNPLLHDSDYIYVPERMDMVWVSGQVRFPGLLPYVEGKKWEQYIADAGGYTNNRRLGGVRIIQSHSGNWIKPDKKININPGDIIFVAEQTDRDTWLDIKDIVLLTSQLVTILIGVSAMTK